MKRIFGLYRWRVAVALALAVPLMTSVAVVTQPAAARAETEAAIDAQTREALGEALADLRNKKAFYDAVMAEHGKVKPFTNIANAEAHQALVIEKVYRRHELEVPASAAPTGYTVPDSLRESCLAAAAAERESASLYAGLAEKVSDGDIRGRFNRLRTLSTDYRIPAFERCAEGGRDFAQYVPGSCSGGCGMGKAACGCGAAAPPKEPARPAGGCGCAARRAAQQAQTGGGH